MYGNLTGEESVHLSNFPVPNMKLYDDKLEKEMDTIRKIVEMAHSKRKKAMIKVRQPLAELEVKNAKLKINEDLIKLIMDEINVKKVVFEEGKEEMSVALDTNLTKELRDEGEARDIVREIQKKRKMVYLD